MHLNRLNYFWAAAFALCLPVFGFGFDSALAKSNGSNSSSSSSSSSAISASFSYSSQVSGGTVTIYGKSTASSQSSKPATTQTSVSKAPAKVVPKPPSKLPAKPPVQPIPRPSASLKPTPSRAAVAKAVSPPKLPAKSTITNLLRASPKPAVPVILRPPVFKPNSPKASAPPKAPAKKTVVTIKLPATNSNTTTSAAGQATFSPNEVSANAYPPTVKVGEPVLLVASAAQHYRLGQILNRATEVRFTPINTTWAFANGVTIAGAALTQTFDSPGSHTANVTVRYLVSYRFAGQTAWVAEPGFIELTDKVEVLVATSGQTGLPNLSPNSDPDALRPYLVGSNCIQRPSAFGCGVKQ